MTANPTQNETAGAGHEGGARPPAGPPPWLVPNVMLPLLAAILTALALLLAARGPPVDLWVLCAACGLWSLFCGLAIALDKRSAWAIPLLAADVSLAAISGAICRTYLLWFVRVWREGHLQDLDDISRNALHLLDWIQTNFGVAAACVPLVAPMILLFTTGLAVLRARLLMRRLGVTVRRPRWLQRLLDAISNVIFALEPLLADGKVGAALRFILATSPAATAAVYLLSGPYRHDIEIQVMMASGIASLILMPLLAKAKSRVWRIFQLSFHTGTSVIASEVLRLYLAEWLAWLPRDPIRAVGDLPWLLSDHIDALQAQYGTAAGISPILAPAFTLLASCFAAEQAFRLIQGLGKPETGRPRAKSSLYGSARFMPRHHMRRLSRQPGGLILGAETRSPRSRLVSYPLAGSALTLAPPRTGKTATAALNLLRPDSSSFHGSTIVIDPRGELWCITAKRRMDLGRRVLLLDPFGVVDGLKSEWPELENLPSESERWNPMDFIRDGEEGIADLDVVLDALLTPPEGSGDTSRHFYDAARAIIGGYIAWTRFGPGDPEERTLTMVESALVAGRDQAQGMATGVEHNPDVGFGRVARAIQRMERVGEQEAGSNFSTIANQLEWLRFPPLQAHTSKSSVDVRGICDGNTDLFVVAPARLLDQVRPWLRLWVAVPDAIASEQVGPDRRDMLILLDEMPRLGYLAPVMNAYTMAAGVGVHFWGIVQSLSALERSYGDRNAEMLLDNTELIQILGFPNTAARDADRFSAALGTATFRAPSRDPSTGGPPESIVRERLVTVHDLLSMPEHSQYVVASSRGMPRDALRLAKASYWLRPDVMGAGHNPYVLRKG